jgi:hypothetical protein
MLAPSIFSMGACVIRSTYLITYIGYFYIFLFKCSLSLTSVYILNGFSGRTCASGFLR